MHLKKIFFLTLLIFFSSSFSQQKLRVAVSEISPCAMKNEQGQLTGFSIELWGKIARLKNINFSYKLLNQKQKLDAVKSGQADLAIAGISITARREKYLDFTSPTLNSGLLTLILAEQSIWPTFSTKTKRFLLYLLLFILICGHVIWFSEKGKAAINDNYIPGIFESFWFVFVTMTTVGYGDIAPKNWKGRIAAVLIMLSGIAFFGIIISQLTADAMEKRSRLNIKSYHDLSGKRVATKANTTSVKFLRRIKANVVPVKTIEKAYQLLLDKKVRAVVYDAPALLYYSKKNQKVMTVGDIFAKQYYGFAVPSKSPLRETINRALCVLRENGSYEELYNKWFD